MPEDFLVVLGMAVAFSDPKFRLMMKALVRQGQISGRFDGIMHNDDEPLH